MVDQTAAPYFDDYDATKKYMKMLFQPSRALQVRELNQLQTMLQSQISRFGGHIFSEGSQVAGGEVGYDTELAFLKMTYAGYAANAATLDSDTFTIEDPVTGVKAELLYHIDAEAADPVTFFVKYTESGSNDEKVFPDATTVEIRDSSGVLLDTATVDETGIGSSVKVSAGIYYVRGQFVVVDAQSIILEKYSSKPSYRAGFEILETVVTSDDDATLLDNANGSPNATSPGADRLKLELVLSKRLEADVDDENFVEIVRLKSGVIEEQVRTPDYNVLEETLARRTYDESGNYTIEPFGILVREHLDDENGNEGVFPLADGGDEAKLAIGLESGKAYVHGFEVENLDTVYVSANKARTTAEIQNSSTYVDYENFVEVDNLTSIPDISALPRVDLYSGVLDVGGVAQGSIVGSCAIRAIELDSGTQGAPTSVYKVFVFDIQDISGNPNASVFNSAQSIFVAGSPNFGADIVTTNGKLQGAAKNSAVFPLPVKTVKSLRNGGGSLDTSYAVTRSFNATTDASGNVTITAGASESFETFSVTEYHACKTGDGTVANLSGKVTLGGTPFGKNVTLALGAGWASTQIRVVAPVMKQVTSHKTKTLSTHTAQYTPNANGVITLTHADVIKIKSVSVSAPPVADADNLKDQFELIPNRKPSYYDLSQIKFKSNYIANSNTVYVEYEYFEHGAGDYFSVDSYADIDYAEIPFDTINGIETSLADVLDFRPRIDNTGNDFTSGGASRGDFPQRLNYVTADIVHYLPRIDKLWVNGKGEFGVTEGVPAIAPAVPTDPDDAMVLYTLDIPAYTRSPSDVGTTFHENRRYTMRDIGKLENRIKNLEYYVSLSALEEQTASLQIVDDQTGLARTKNGFVVDNFVDHKIGDSTRSDYRCSVDGANQELRPQFAMEGVDLEYDASGSSNVQLTGELITLPYTSQELFKQPYASTTMNVNPYAVFNWEGSIKLTPRNDTWTDVRYTQPDRQVEVINRTVNRTVTRPTINRVEPQPFNNTWDIWRDMWVGRDTLSSVRRFDSRLRGVRVIGRNTPVATASSQVLTDVSRSVNTSTSSKVVGDKVVSTAVIPFMRAKKIKVEATGMKPFAKLYAFFDGKDVTQYVTDNGGGSNLKTNAAGKFTGWFNLPAGKFRTGSRTFKLTDSAENDDLATSQSETSYSAKGTRVTRQKTILSTQTVTTTVTTTNQRVNRTRWQDPLAQSFLIENNGGAFITKIDVFFATKDQNVPVTLQVREMENGYPSQRQVPYGEVVLDPANVTTSEDGTAATSFVFDSPVYLQESVEYCFVLMANSTRYNVYIARMGENVIGQNRTISKQPFVGVLFKSQNNSTWSAAQNEDMKFTIHRAKFNTGVVGNLALKNTTPEAEILAVNALSSQQSSSTITVKQFNHGLVPGAWVTISGALDGAGLTADSHINGVRQVVATPNLDEFTFTAPASATSTGSFGGNAILCEKNFMYDVLNVNVGEMKVGDTEIDWSVRTTTGKSFDGGESFGVKNSNYVPIILGQNMLFNNPRVVLNTENESNYLSGQPSLTVTGDMSSTRDNISPVIDVNQLMAITVNNRVNYPSSLEETVVADSNAAARYQTQMIELAESADTLRIYIDADKPKNTAVKVYYKATNTPDGFADLDWTEATGVNVTGTTDDGNFYENEYEDLNLDEFTFFAVKIVLLSTNSSFVPRVKNLRAIAVSG